MTSGRLDREMVGARLAYLAEAVAELRELQSLSYEQLAKSRRDAWAVEHGLQVCVQAVLDVASHLVAVLGGPVADDYHNTILGLAELDVLPSDVARRLAPMSGFRNVVVHEYLAVELREVHHVLIHHVEDFLMFARHVEAYLQRHPS